jgi:outer membrane protein assembly factor BamB
MFRTRKTRRRLVAVAVLIAAVLVAGGVAYAILKSRTGSIFNSGVAFNSQHAGGKPSAPPDRFLWPYYGYSADHLRYLDANIAPPFQRRWSFKANALLEFPPVIANGVLYQLDDDAVINAVDKETGRLRWTRQLGEHSASTPAIGNGVVYVTVLKRAGARGGLVAALGAGDGHLVWQRELPSGSESSPLFAQGLVYFGTQDGTVYALDGTTGATRWT